MEKSARFIWRHGPGLIINIILSRELSLAPKASLKWNHTHSAKQTISTRPWKQGELFPVDFPVQWSPVLKVVLRNWDQSNKKSIPATVGHRAFPDSLHCLFTGVQRQMEGVTGVTLSCIPLEKDRCINLKPSVVAKSQASENYTTCLSNYLLKIPTPSVG